MTHSIPGDGALGTSELFLSFQENLQRLADSERPVLIVGERGTGKELAAQRLHYFSARWDKALITVLCPGLSPALLESELFGHEAGAFTGAQGRRQGRFELADKGTLFLDEVADMPMPLQDKLLRVLEYGTFERVGGSATLRPDVRVVAATNRDLPRLAAEGRFRADLLDRLCFEVVHVPPLRTRGADVLLLAQHFAAAMALEAGWTPEQAAQSSTLSPEVVNQLREYSWPGNVRELKNAVERSLLRQGPGTLTRLVLDPFMSPWEGARVPQLSVNVEADTAAVLHGSASPASLASFLHAASTALPQAVCPVPAPVSNGLESGYSLPGAVAQLERAALAQALSQSRHRQTEAARLLGLSYHQFRALYRKYGKDDEGERA